MLKYKEAEKSFFRKWLDLYFKLPWYGALGAGGFPACILLLPFGTSFIFYTWMVISGVCLFFGVLKVRKELKNES